MDSLENSSKSASGFFKHVFQFDEDSKGDILNIIQYALLATIPIVVVNKIMQKYVPEADEEKGSLEIVGEVLLQIIGMFLSLFFVNRIITYVPTYSGVKYPDISVIFVVMSILMITMSLQTKLGEKVTILADRVSELWNGKSDEKAKGKGKGKGKGNVRVSQPISQSANMAAMNQSMSPGMMQNDGSGTLISQLPIQREQLPDYNNMHQNNQTPLVGAATPGMGQYDMGPVAANEAFGGMFGGTTF